MIILVLVLLAIVAYIVIPALDRSGNEGAGIIVCIIALIVAYAAKYSYDVDVSKQGALEAYEDVKEEVANMNIMGDVAGTTDLAVKKGSVVVFYDINGELEAGVVDSVEEYEDVLYITINDVIYIVRAQDIVSVNNNIANN